jgi:anti-sigma-K factor RskA
VPVSHSEYEELAAGYVLGALEPDDEHAFIQHLGGCAICEANVRELETVAGELAYAAPPVDPPDTLWAGIRREIRPEAVRRGAVPAVVSGTRTGGGRGRRLLPGLVAAAAIVLVVVLSLWNLNLRDQNAIYRDRVAALERVTQLANDPNAALITLANPAGSAAQATVIASSPQDRGVLVVEDLPPLQRGRVYELWGVPGGKFADAQKALVFVPLRRGVHTYEFKVPIQPGTVFAITDEPGPTGSSKPTTEPLLVGKPTIA